MPSSSVFAPSFFFSPSGVYAGSKSWWSSTFDPGFTRSGSLSDRSCSTRSSAISAPKYRWSRIAQVRERNDLVELASRLVAIDSVNPALVEGGAGEREAALLVADWCGRRGLEVEVVGDERPSVIARRRGSGGGRSLLLNGHLDTVGVVGMDAPFEPRVEDGRLYGRGSYDMKGALAAIVVAAADADGLRGDVIVTAVCDEELGLAGAGSVLGGDP